jgi:acyl-CoA thioesterase-1
MTADIRICFVGDSLVNGTGDTTALGWTGRVCAAANRRGFVVTGYNLGIRRDTSGDIKARWQEEVDRRQDPQADNRLVFSFGVNDTTEEVGGLRIQPSTSLANAHDILGRAQHTGSVLLIGPSPVADAAQNERIAHFSMALSELAAGLSIPFLAVFDALYTGGNWMNELHNGDGSHPDAGGYAQLASLVLQWPAWWFYESGAQGMEM